MATLDRGTLKQQTFQALVATRDDETNPDVTYFGIADMYTLDSESKWAIKRFVSSGGVIKGEFAVMQGGSIFSNVWNDRSTLVYK